MSEEPGASRRRSQQPRRRGGAPAEDERRAVAAVRLDDAEDVLLEVALEQEVVEPLAVAVDHDAHLDGAVLLAEEAGAARGGAEPEGHVGEVLRWGRRGGWGVVVGGRKAGQAAPRGVCEGRRAVGRGRGTHGDGGGDGDEAEGGDRGVVERREAGDALDAADDGLQLRRAGAQGRRAGEEEER